LRQQQSQQRRPLNHLIEVNMLISGVGTVTYRAQAV
jgi:hypothetical protein